MKIIILPEWDGLEVKAILFSRLSLSRAMVSRLKRIKNGILLDGENVTVRKKVSVGQTLSIYTDDTEDEVNPNILPCELPIDIIYEDDNIAVVNKPSGMPTVPTYKHRNDTLANAMVYIYKNSGKPFVFRPVNRLDRETSGVVLVAKNKIASDVCSKDFRNQSYVKTYLALIEGKPENDKGIISGYIKRSTTSIIKRELVHEGSQSEFSETSYELLKSNGQISLLKLIPITGKTHQIRVHLSSIGCPILGDGLYGKYSNIISRCALHSFSLIMKIPFSDDEKTEFTADIPEDMRTVINELL